MRESVLYYPHIEIQNKDWLKNALLVWDHVYRIVPKSYTPRDDFEMNQAVAAGLVRSVELEDEDVQGVTKEFQNFIEHLDFLPAGLEYDELAYLHPEKIDANLYPLLEQYSAESSREGWLELPRELVRGYMFFLANKVAQRRNLMRCTDDEYSFGVAPYFSEEANFSEALYDPSPEGFYGSLNFGDLLPLQVSEIPMDQIIQSCQKSRDEKKEFRQELLKFSTALHKCESKDHAETIAEDFKADLISAKDRLKGSQGFVGDAARGSLFTMGLPVSLTAFGGIVAGGADPFGPYAIGGALSIGAVAAYQDFKKTVSIEDNPYGAAYLISLEERFAGADYCPAFDRFLEEFVND